MLFRSAPDATTGGGYLDAIGPRLAAAFIERGLLLRPLGHVLYVMPPYVITDDEVGWVADEVEAVLLGLLRDPVYPPPTLGQ